MPKKLKTLDSTEGRAPLLVPHPEEADLDFRQLSLRFLQSRQWRAFRHRLLADRIICEHESGCPYPGEHLHHMVQRRVTNQDTWYDKSNIQVLCAKHHNQIRENKRRAE